MNNFWENILRYPRFFVSSFIGLIFIIINPIKNLLKTTQSRVILSLLICVFFISINLIIKNMVGL